MSEAFSPMTFETTQCAVLLTDIVNSAAHIETMGDLPFAALMSEFEQDIRHLIRQHHGREIDKTDGFLIVFKVPVEALAFAVALNSYVARFAGSHGHGLKMRTGLHFGNIVMRSNSPQSVAAGAKSVEIDGLTKIIAARVTALADAGQILITRVLFDTVREDESSATKIPEKVQWLAHGPYLLQGLQDPVDIFEVGLKGLAPLKPPANKDKARRAILPQDEFALGWRPATGQIIPTAADWRLVRKLGEGGYGEVWLAEHVKAPQTRVFKFCFDPARMRSLKREKFLLNIVQENLGNRDDIVKILNWNLTEAPYFIALQHIPVENLATWMDRRRSDEPLTPKTVLTITRKIAAAMAAAHSVGILHKDIKPSNLLIGGEPDNPDIYLIDFGIGLYTPPDQEQTQANADLTTESDRTTLRTSSLSGSRMYVAPEVLEGKMPTVQADIYALGVILYQLLRNELNIGLKVGWERDIRDPFLVSLIAEATDGNLRNRLRTAAELIDRIDTMEARREDAAAEHLRQEKRARQSLALEAQKRRKVLYAVAMGIAIPLALVSAVFAFRSNEASKVAADKAAEATTARQKAGALISFMVDDLNKELRDAGKLPIMDSITSQALSYYSTQSTASLNRNEMFLHMRTVQNLASIALARNDITQASKLIWQADRLYKATLPGGPLTTNTLALRSEILHTFGLIRNREGDTHFGAADLYKSLKLARLLYNKHPDNLELVLSYVEKCQAYANATGARIARGFLEDCLGATLAASKYYPQSRELQYQSAIISDTINNFRGGPKADPQQILRDIKTLEAVHAAEPDNYRYALSLAGALKSDGERLLYADNSGAVQRLTDAQKLFTELHEQDPSNQGTVRMLASNQMHLAMALAGNQDFDSALQHVEKAAQRLEASMDLNKMDADVADDYWKCRKFYQNLLGYMGNTNEQLRIARGTNLKIKSMLDRRFHIPMLQNYIYSSVQLSGLARSSDALDECVKFLNDFLEHPQVRLLRKDASFQRIFRAAQAFLVYPLIFEDVSSTWLTTAVPAPARETFSTVDAVNEKAETCICRLYRPGSSVPYTTELIGSHAGSFSVSPFSSDCDGVSINGEPIVPLYTVENVSPASPNYLRFDVERYWSLCGEENPYNLAVDLSEIMRAITQSGSARTSGTAGAVKTPERAGN